jgi:transposase-like protein
LDCESSLVLLIDTIENLFYIDVMDEPKHDLVLALLRSGHTYQEIAERTGLAKATISYHAKKQGLARQRARPRYDWDKVQAYYDAGHTVRECAAHFGFNKSTWSSAVKQGRVKARHASDQFLARLKRGAKLTRVHVKRRLIAVGLLIEECATCGIREWRGRPLALEIDHINGDRHDWRLENLRLLCPNCHSQTETYGGRNRKRRVFQSESHAR